MIVVGMERSMPSAVRFEIVRYLSSAMTVASF